MIYVGVDPGKAGAVAVLDEAGQLLELFATPMIPGPMILRKNGKKTRGPDDYDLTLIARFFRDRVDRARPDRGMFVTVERLTALPAFARGRDGKVEQKGGTLANFNRGVSLGWAWMLTAYRIPFQLVRPQEWQRQMLGGMPGKDPKPKSITAAKRTWPDVSLRRTSRAKTDDDGLSDALWLAEFGRRARVGGPVFAGKAGTGGFVDFGKGAPAKLHGAEAVVPAGKGGR